MHQCIDILRNILSIFQDLIAREIYRNYKNCHDNDKLWQKFTKIYVPAHINVLLTDRGVLRHLKEAMSCD